MSKGETVHAMKKPALNAATNCVARPIKSFRIIRFWVKSFRIHPLADERRTNPRICQKKNKWKLRTCRDEFGLHDQALDLVVAGHLSTVQHHRSHDVRIHSTVKSLHACKQREDDEECWIMLFGSKKIIRAKCKKQPNRGICTLYLAACKGQTRSRRVSVSFLQSWPSFLFWGRRTDFRRSIRWRRPENPQQTWKRKSSPSSHP